MQGPTVAADVKRKRRRASSPLPPQCKAPLWQQLSMGRGEEHPPLSTSMQGPAAAADVNGKRGRVGRASSTLHPQRKAPLRQQLSKGRGAEHPLPSSLNARSHCGSNGQKEEEKSTLSPPPSMQGPAAAATDNVKRSRASSPLLPQCKVPLWQQLTM